MRADVTTRVAEYCAKHRLLVVGEPVLALVSGGADSLTLMHTLTAVHSGPVVVLSVDHGLRPVAREEAATVRVAATRLGIEAHVVSLSLEDGPGLQERARDARHVAAREFALEHAIPRIATGHTASDQAETVLFRLARGTGRTGALGMAPRRGALIRPLLCVTRRETHAFCEERGLDAVDDPSNADARFARSRVRSGLLPALERVNPDGVVNVARFADQLRDEAMLVAPLLAAAWDRCITRGGGLDATRVLAEVPAMQRMLVRAALTRHGGTGDAHATAAVERVLAVARGDARETELPGGMRVVGNDGVVTFAAAGVSA